jgi:hypothetical protein
MVDPKVDEATIEELIALVLQFHMKTGASIIDIQELIRRVGEINSKMAIKIMKEELDKI